MDDPTTKRCTRCALDLPLSAFPKNRAKPDGLGGYCKACKSAYDIERRANNPGMQSAYAADYRKRKGDELRAWTKEHYARNRERIRAYRQEYALQNPDRVRAWTLGKSTAWYRANKERARANARAWIATRPGYQAAHDRRHYERHMVKCKAYNQRYRRANLLYYRAASSRRRALERNAPHVEKIDYVAITKRDNSTCYLCLRHLEPHEITYDHVVPIARNGDHTNANHRVACSPCNSRKNDKLLEELDWWPPS